MTFTYTLDNIPEGTTHVWTPALNKPHGLVEPLAFFAKRQKGIWKVYSRKTGWRKSINGPEWFSEERAEGFLVTVKQALDAAKKEKA
jgi:hypothetical protein